ncbi:MAG: DUF1552 domain-containing protein [Myxococcaceae bacterium]|nr:DUF1552 domain-containing protein [Myxococcaceae bacterium]
MTVNLTRRLLLRGAGGAALALPLLESLGCAPEKRLEERHVATVEQGLTFPKRVIFFYTPNGNLDLPANMSFAGTSMAPLQPYASKMVLISGLDMLANDIGPGEPHQQGMAVLTGRKLNTGTQVGGDGSLSGWAMSKSVDQAIADVIGVGTRFKTLNLGVQSTQYGGTEVRTVLSYTGNDQPVANETSPFALYSRVFGSLGADPFGLERERLRKHAAIDFAKERFRKLNARLSTEDRVKLEHHLDSMRDVESRIDAPGGTVGMYCSQPNPGAMFNLTDPATFPQVGRLMMDQAAMALACDLTRVVTLQWSASTNNRPYPFLSYDNGTGLKPILGDEHILGHQPDSDVHAWGQLAVIRRWYMEQLKYLLDKLDAVPEGPGTMLDNTVVLWFSEITRGNTHSHKAAPFFTVGGAGGAIRTNRYLSFQPGVPHNNLLVALMNAMGVQATTFGDPAFCTGPLGGLLV